ncbi:MAG: DNA N-6-adenine-methyltransferase [Nanoarchaeota archaeon]
MLNQGLFSSKTDLWSTPQHLFNELNKEFNFTVDVCANKNNNKCNFFYSVDDDGLKQNWTGICWMNPPYGREIKKWIKKAYESGKNGTIVVGLLPSRTDTSWFHDFIYGKAEIRFIRGRLKFGDGKNSAPFPSMIVVWK